MSTRTVRELAGEIWAEIGNRQDDPKNSLGKMDVEQVQEIVDLVMGVLARYVETQIINDADLPVVPLPLKTPT